MEVGGWINGDQYNGRIVRIANSFVFKEPVFNYSREFPFLWDEFTLPVRYGSDWKLAQRLIEDAVMVHVGDFTRRSHDLWNGVVRKFMIEQARVEPMVTLVATDNWIEFTARYIVDYKARRLTRDARLGVPRLGVATPALGVLAEIHARGLRVPDDMSIVALHDVWYADAMWPPITTVKMPLKELGSAAVSLLIDHDPLQLPEHRVIDDPKPLLIERASTAVPVH